jgi:hypothetical protein
MVAAKTTSLERELAEWIDGELDLYVRNMISDGDFATLRKNLIDIAKAHAATANSRATVRVEE